MYFNNYELSKRAYAVDVLFDQLDWDILVKSSSYSINSITNLNVRSGFIRIDVFKASNASFSYVNRFFSSLFINNSVRLNLFKNNIGISGNFLTSLNYNIASKVQNAFIYILMFDLFFKNGVSGPWSLSPVILSNKHFSVYFRIFNSFFIRPLYDFGDIEWSAHLRLMFFIPGTYSIEFGKFLASFVKANFKFIY